MSKDKTSVLNNYKPALDEDLNVEHTIKEFAGKTDRHGKFTVYTDGSAQGASETRDLKSFAGWGFYFKDELPDGRKVEGTKYGHIFNADAESSELKALLEALRFNNHPSHFEVVSDCSSVVLGLRDIHEKMASYHSIVGSSRTESLSMHESKNLVNLKVWKNIYDELYSNENIVSLKIRWVRSHVLTRDEVRNPPNPEDFSRKNERRLVEDIVGNNKADQCANLGAIKAIRSALFFYKNIKMNDRELQRSINTCKKNFNNTFSSDEAVRFLSQQPKDFLPKDIYETIIPLSARDKITALKENSNSPEELRNNINDMLSSAKIQAFNAMMNDQATGTKPNTVINKQLNTPSNTVMNDQADIPCKENVSAADKFKKRYGRFNEASASM